MGAVALSSLQRPGLFACAAVLVCAVLLGGGTYQATLGDVVVQIASVFLLTMCVWHCPPQWYRTNWLAMIVPGVFLFAAATQVANFAGSPFETPLITESLLPATVPALASSHLSATPQATLAATVSILPAVTVFFCVGLLSPEYRLRLGGVILTLGGLSLALGMLQIMQGPESPLRFFEITNSSDSVGFFANRNHYAALLYVTLLLTSPWLIMIGRERGAKLPSKTVIVVAAGLLLIAVTVGIAAARSRAGVVFTLAALCGVALVAILSTSSKTPQSQATRLRSHHVIIGVVGFATWFAAQFGLHRILERFSGEPIDDLRYALTANTLEQAWQSLPLGTGLGSFVPVYSIIERPADLFVGYANRAHNDFVELFLELGLFSLLILLAFTTWFLSRSFAVWLVFPKNSTSSEIALQRAGSICVLLLLAHSTVDYPLRTTALSVIFAYCCGLLLPAMSLSRRSSLPNHETMVAAVSAKGEKSIENSDGIFDSEWPEQWRKR